MKYMWVIEVHTTILYPEMKQISTGLLRNVNSWDTGLLVVVVTGRVWMESTSPHQTAAACCEETVTTFTPHRESLHFYWRFCWSLFDVLPTMRHHFLTLNAKKTLLEKKCATCLTLKMAISYISFSLETTEIATVHFKHSVVLVINIS